MTKVLITGICGYIGQHVAKEFLNNGVEVVGIDDHSNVLEKNRWRSVYGHPIYKLNVASETDMKALTLNFSAGEIDAIIHLAAKIDSNESIKLPLDYYRVNVNGTLNVLEFAKVMGIKNLVFASSAAVYHVSSDMVDRFREEDASVAETPYGWSKLIAEQAIRDYISANHDVDAICLRLFNVAGASSNGEIGESHMIETHLIPQIIKSHYSGQTFKCQGTGSSLRDYVHVEDVARAFFAAYKANVDGNHLGFSYNICTGHGNSVTDILDRMAFRGVSPVVEMVNKREDDLGDLVGDNSEAAMELGWAPLHDIERILESAIAWHVPVKEAADVRGDQSTSS